MIHVFSRLQAVRSKDMYITIVKTDSYNLYDYKRILGLVTLC